ncbi:hypothetical protein [Nonomuraea pusilla]|uniref:WD40-like Beta Propeller Repeat n=1 Tax=Nonomuraea pusilla TaxID=46177 RepID=A0A1H7MUG6_9ACTN|nr:hypothetical protein [Nonomuraea pusilla]SEL14930.1 hypothetical protein SAMN05660976_01822 [Nonomuraea pusilla]
MIARLAAALTLTLLAPATARAEPLTARADVSLPGSGGVTYREQAGDPVRLTAYGLGTRAAYLRAPSGAAFTRNAALSEVSVSPDGRLAAGVPKAYRDGFDALVLTDRATGRSVRVRTVRKPLTASYASWSRDGRRVALTVQSRTGGAWRAVGFTVVDVRTGAARTVGVAGLPPKAGFWWSPGGSLVASYGGGVRFYRAADGAVVRTLRGVGRPTGPEDPFSPSGTRLATWCPPPSGRQAAGEQLCVVDVASGTVARRMAPRPEAVFGWWDDTHLVGVARQGTGYRLAVLDLAGRATRALADVPRPAWDADLWVSFTRARAK